MRISFVCIVGVALVVSAPAIARSSLSPEDANRRVCVPTRDKAGEYDGGSICKTGRQWERQLILLDRAKRGRLAAAAPARPQRVYFQQPYLGQYGWHF